MGDAGFATQTWAYESQSPVPSEPPIPDDQDISDERPNTSPTPGADEGQPHPQVPDDPRPHEDHPQQPEVEQPNANPRPESPTLCFCGDAPSPPVWTPCAHIFCRHHLARWMQGGGGCPLDRQELDYEAVFGNPPCEEDARSVSSSHGSDDDGESDAISEMEYPVPGAWEQEEEEEQAEDPGADEDEFHEDEDEFPEDAEDDIDDEVPDDDAMPYADSIFDPGPNDAFYRFRRFQHPPLFNRPTPFHAPESDPMTDTVRFLGLLLCPRRSFNRLIALRDQYGENSVRWTAYNDLAVRISLVVAEMDQQIQRQGELMETMRVIGEDDPRA